LKLRMEVGDEDFLLDYKAENGQTAFTLTAPHPAPETAVRHASIAEVQPGVYSVLLEGRSFTVQIDRSGDQFEAWSNGCRYVIGVADPRDRSPKGAWAGATGPIEIRAQMPGRVVKLLVEAGDSVEAGQGLIVVEAMKMQNETRSPKKGVVRRIHVAEGTAVAAGELLLIID
jgi:biotin carboxyl carrier protein